MVKAEEKQEVIKEMEAVANPKNFTTIPNSTAEFCVYTYKAEYETTTQISRAGFFNSASTFLNVGDCIRTFRFDEQKNLTHYLEYVVMGVDKINRTVTVSCIANHNLLNKVID